MSLPTAKEVTNLYLYGQKTTPNNLVDDSLIRPNPLPINPTLTVDVVKFMDSKTGPGRFAVGSQFELIQKFFDPGFFTPSIPPLAPGKPFYTKAEIAGFFGLGRFDLVVQQLNYQDSLDDYAERTYIFNTLAFQISNSARFFVTSTGQKWIEDFGIEPRRDILDDFDFVGGGALTNFGNSIIQPRIDPSNIGRVVDIKYTDGSSPKVRYDITSYEKDQAIVGSWGGRSLLKLNSDISRLTNDLFANGVTRFLDSKNRPIIYGTQQGDSLSVVNLTGAPLLRPFAGGAAALATNGLVLIGGLGNDNLTGAFGNDDLIGGSGNDILNGGSAEDTSIYEGNFDDYEIEFLKNGSVKITDSSADRDGSDTLTDIEFAEFSDKKVNLEAGQDIAFVIDTTGSMFDDIDAVKARSSEIINTIFDGDRGFIDSRIAVVGYNDPGTNTFLSFTDQPKIEDRKTAAINAINSISVGGGGDFPEVVNAGLIRALSGGAGKWREEAAVRRIILFGDAPPKDTELRSEVLRLAEDIGVESVPTVPRLAAFSIASDIETTSLTSGLMVTRFEAEATDTDGATVKFPVEIFTVLIGSDPTTREDFESLADATGGQAFNAANASELVDKLIDAINEPVDGSSNTPPELIDDDITTILNTAVNIDVLANDSDTEGDTLSISSVTNPMNGSTEIVDNQIRFTPDSLFLGQNSFNYTASDSEGSEATATVTVSVVLPEDAIIGTNNQDNLNGTNVADVISGEAGNDNINGNGGADILFGKEGDDNINGTKSSEQISGGEGNDLISGNGGNDIILGGFGDDDILLGSGSPTVNSGSGNDEIWVNNANATFILETGDGFDTFYGLQTQQIEDKLISFGVGNVDSIEFERIGNGIDIFSAGDKIAQLDNFNQQQQLDLLETNKSEIFFEVV